MKNVSVLGTGKMGSGIAASLIRAGYTVTVWNRTKEKTSPLLDQGGLWAETPSAAARNADAVITMLADDAASTEIWLGKDGALDSLRPDAYMIECTTISLRHAARLAAAAKPKHIHYIDCPVTGWPEHAQAGALTLLVGASQSDVEKVKPVLQAFSKSIIVFGEPGKGTAYKLMINLMGAVQIAALAEGIALAEKLGLSKEQVVQGIQTSVAASPQVIKNAPVMTERNFDRDPHFTVGLRKKDTLYAVDMAKEFGASVPLGEAALAWFEKAAELGKDKDQAVVIECVAKKSNID